jgi:hypothetical protein
VLYVTCDMNARVPSLPTRRCLIISMGSSGEKSTRALMEYPVVHLMLNLRVISAHSSLFACTNAL